MITPITSKPNTKTSIFYINDYHGKTINMERTITASNIFDEKYKNQKDVDVFKLSTGDIMIGMDETTNKLAAIFQDIIGIEASTIGNHEFDMHNNIEKFLPQMGFKVVSSNIDVSENSPWKKAIQSSIIEERNGHKYGIIGACPTELNSLIVNGPIKDDIFVASTEQSILKIQKEVEKLQAQGVNKIILLSHLGYETDKRVAQETQGIDVILGGHSHNLLTDIKVGKNLFYSKTAEPVVLVQAGRDGKYFGVLNLEFNDSGIVKKVQNNVGYTKDFRRYAPAKYIFDKVFGVKDTLGEIKYAPPAPTNELTEPNGHAYFVADCIKKDLDCDIAILPSSNIRGYFETGKVDSRTLMDILPFKNNLWMVNYSEKDIVTTFKKACKSLKTIDNKPGIFYASGLKYSVSSEGELLSMSFVNKEGNETAIDINNPKDNKYYTTVITDYCAEGNDGFTELNKPDNIIKKYNFDATRCIIDVMRKTIDPIEIYDDGRLKIIDEQL